ncbi:MAG: hypothetical protein GAK29_02469 [Acinetobacter bereziniae]|uniref:Uncharacterized protein n=1 Tax=Acinetobacter bereziniae TaxID=106648 RepID=A0A833PG15_ACIBZ|nr:MAG: hypothetical protein GAK29_02469 [Acinetobacter bereziniae]
MNAIHDFSMHVGTNYTVQLYYFSDDDSKFKVNKIWK